MQRLACVPAWILLWFCLQPAAVGQVFDERFEDWPVNLKIAGRLLIAAELDELKLLDALLPAADPREKCLLIEADLPVSAVSEQYAAQFETLATCTIDQLEQLKPHDAPEFVAWHTETTPQTAIQLVRVGRVATALTQLLASGKSVIVTGSGADMVGKFFWPANGVATSKTGYQLLPDCVMELSFAPSQSQQLMRRVRSHKRCVGIGLEPHTLLMLDGRQLRVAGAGRGWLMLPAGAELPARVETIAARRGRYHSVTEWLADLTEWRRDAIDRTLEPFPPAEPQPPMVAQGTLVIVGGGGMPSGLMQRFVELAGGPQAAKLVYIPCAEDEQIAPRSSTIDAWHALGVQQASMLHTKDRQQANSDELFLAPLADATGIWFGGGRQWNLADSYYGTQAHHLMKQVLSRGGVIGGSSAGASIQARYLARATPIENLRLMAPGYERGGLGFLSGVAIDQHFSQRGRQADMTQLVQRYPQLLGIGIDEATALVIQGSQAEITGQGDVYFYDARQAKQPSATDYLKVTAGETYDLVERRVLSQSQ